MLCLLCFEQFANAPLKCSHKLCPSCYEKLDACPLRRVKFKDDVCVFTNFDACVYRHPAQPVTYDVFAYGGKMRDSLLLLKRLIHVLEQRGITFSLGVSETGDNVKFYEISDAEPEDRSVACAGLIEHCLKYEGWECSMKHFASSRPEGWKNTCKGRNCADCEGKNENVTKRDVALARALKIWWRAGR